MPDTIPLRDVPMPLRRTISTWITACRFALGDIAEAVNKDQAAEALALIDSLRDALDELRLAIEPHVKESEDA